MTVSYSYEVSNNKLFGLLRLLLKWTGSIWKVLLLDMSVYFILYAALRVIKLHVLTDDQQMSFDEFCIILKNNITKIPLAFLLGFFVSHVYSRWWAIYNSIPWPFSMIDALCLTLKVPDTVPANEREEKQQELKIIIQTVSRYMHLSLAMVMRDICLQFRELMKKRQLTFVDMGLASEIEMAKLYSTKELMDFELRKLNWDSSKVNEKKRCASWTWWVPAAWATRLVRDAYDRGFVDSHENVTFVYEKIHQYRGLVGGLVGYDWICVPLPYSQVVALGVYVYFFLSLFAYQTVETINLGSNYDTYFVPGGLVLEFIIYYGWFKVAEVLLTPYGTDVGYNYDMIGVFALQLEQARSHVEYSFSLDDFLKKDPTESLKVLARVPLEQLFVSNINENLFGSLVNGIIDIPSFIFDKSIALWKLPQNVWNNELCTDKDESRVKIPGSSGDGGGQGAVYFKNKNVDEITGSGEKKQLTMPLICRNKLEKTS